MRIHNTLTRRKEDFRPIEPGHVGIYVCGPTVWDYMHIGNARPFVFFDVVRRYLRYRGYTVKYVQNFTDVDDKIINRANRLGLDPMAMAEDYIKAYFEDTETLGVDVADVHPRASQHIGEIVALVQDLIAKGYAYEIDGDVFFSAAKDPQYGQLSGQSLDDLKAGARVEVDERKRAPEDFALWKQQKPGEPAWPSPWGPGRPGWHIECSAMVRKHLGQTADIHGGGSDLIFPHHENEAAQSRAATGAPLANYWVHNAFLNIDGEKMSKSLGNFVVPREIMKRYRPEALRFFLLSAHYRSPLNFTEDQLKAADAALERLYNALAVLEQWRGVTSRETMDDEERKLLVRLTAHRERFITAMDDDFNTADAISALFELTREVHATMGPGSSKELVSAVIGLYHELGDILGLLRPGAPATLDHEVERLITERQEARRRRDWVESDRIRDELAGRGIILEDTPQGVRWKRK
ncbi:MAG: cysteine--tRNA ligase [Bacillota bacterium]